MAVTEPQAMIALPSRDAGASPAARKARQP